MSTPTYTLNDDVTLPAIGFGTYPLSGEEGVEAIRSAIEVGYRLLDTAVNYENEGEVGEAIRRSGVPARGAASGQQDPRAPPRLRRRDRQRPRIAEATRRRLPRPAPDPLAEPERRQATRRRGARWSTSRAGPGPLHRRLQLHRGAPRPDHRGDGCDTRGQPGRAASVLQPAGDARRPRRLGIRTEAGARWASSRRLSTSRRWPSRRAARRHPGQMILRWHVQLGSLADPEVGDAAAAAREPRRVRLRALRRGDGRDRVTGPAGRPAVRRRPRHPRGDVAAARLIEPGLRVVELVETNPE